MFSAFLQDPDDTDIDAILKRTGHFYGANNPQFTKGAEVNANFKGQGVYLLGKITQARPDGTFDIRYENGEVEASVHSRFIKNSNEWVEGMKVAVDIRGRVVLATIARIDKIGQYCDVEYEDGTIQENVPKDMISTKTNENEEDIGDNKVMELQQVIIGGQSNMCGACTSADGTVIITTLQDNGLCVWNIKTGREINRLRDKEVGAICMSNDKTAVIVGLRNGTVLQWDWEHPRRTTIFSGEHDGSVECITISVDGKTIISGSSDNTIGIWEQNNLFHILKGHKKSVVSVSVSPDGKWMASGSEDKTVCLWDLSKMKKKVDYKGHDHTVFSVCFSKDSKKVISGSWDKSIRIWNVGTGAQENVLEGHEWGVRSVCLTPDGSKIISGSSDKSLRIWDLAKGKQLEVIRGHSNAIVSVCITPDGGRIVACSADSQIYIWRTNWSPDGTSKSWPSAKALNDSSRIGVDRLGFTAYAQAIHSVLSDADPPVCVGLYARWGSGKSFMIQLLKYYFDKSVSIRKSTKELVQWYEEGWAAPVNGNTADKERYYRGCCRRCGTRVCMCFSLCKGIFTLAYIRLIVSWSYEFVVGFFPSENYVLGLVWDLVVDIVRECNSRLMKNVINKIRFFWFLFYHGVEDTQLSEEDFDEMINAGYRVRVHPTQAHANDEENPKDSEDETMEREYIFVDFNAWEFSRSDELWAGLIRNIYQKVELRLSQHSSHNFHARKGESQSPPKIKAIDWKQLWRVKKAKELLVQQYGGVQALRLRLFLFLVLVFGIIITVVLSALGFIDIWTRLVSGVTQALSVVAGIVGVVIAAIPSLRLMYRTNSSVNTSRGDAIFKEANRVQDSIGFLSRVRGELDELFQFMREYEAETKIRLVLVVFVDDLDRCLEGRNVKVLEAIQLILAIPGAPVIAFLAIDSRVVVASIEATINKSLSIRDALVSGYEYMDKIVQVPFCLPDSPQDKVRRYIDSCIVKAADPVTVKKLMEMYTSSLSSIVEGEITYFQSGWNVPLFYQSKDKSQDYTIPYDYLVQVVNSYQRKNTNDDCVELLLALASLFPSAVHLVKQYRHAIGSVAIPDEKEKSQETSYSAAVVQLASKDEIIEQMCTAIVDIILRLKIQPSSVEAVIKTPETPCGLLVQNDPDSPPALNIISALGATICVWKESKRFKLCQSFYHNESIILSLSLNSNTNQIISGAANGCICIWDIAAGKKVAQLDGHTDAVIALCMNLDSSILVSGSTDSSVRIWNFSSLKLIHVLEHDGKVSAVLVTRSNLVVSATTLGTIHLWDIESGRELKVMDVASVEDKRYEKSNMVRTIEQRACSSLCMSLDEKTLYTGLDSGIIYVWDMVTSQQKDTIECGRGTSMRISSLQISHDGRKLLASSKHYGIQIFDMESRYFPESLWAQNDEILSFTISPDGKRIITTSDRMIRIWAESTGERETPIYDSLDAIENLPADNIVHNVQDVVKYSKPAVEVVKRPNVTTSAFQLSTINQKFLQKINKSITGIIAKASLPPDMHHTLMFLCSTSESNPRRLKRVLNVVLIAYEVAKCKPESVDNPEKVIASNFLWNDFSARLAKWIFLCELYPYRMSFLVQILMDLEQKKIFNKNLTNNLNANTKAGSNTVNRVEPLVYYADVDVPTTNAEENQNSFQLMDADSMNVGEFFFLHVEKYLYTINSSEKLMRLDGDPELFATLLYGGIKLDEKRDLKIRCLDILGPLLGAGAGGYDDITNDGMLRDKNFSLMTYAFNLNPSMSKQIGIELQEITTEFELVRSVKLDQGKDNVGAIKNRALLQNSKSIYNKRDMLIKHSLAQVDSSQSANSLLVPSLLEKVQSLEKIVANDKVRKCEKIIEEPNHDVSENTPLMEDFN